MNKSPTIIFAVIIIIIIIVHIMIYVYVPNSLENFMPLTLSINIFISVILAGSIYLIEQNKNRKRKITGCESIAIKLFNLCEELEKIKKSENDEEGNYFKILVAIKQIEYNTLIFSDILPNDDIESLLKPISFWLTFWENNKLPNFDHSYYNMIYNDITITNHKWKRYIAD